MESTKINKTTCIPDRRHSKTEEQTEEEGLEVGSDRLQDLSIPPPLAQVPEELELRELLRGQP